MSQNNDPLICRQEGEIAFIEINRPEKKNAIPLLRWRKIRRLDLKMRGRLKIFSVGSALKESVPFWKKDRPNGHLRNWMKTSFLNDFQRLVSTKLNDQ